MGTLESRVEPFRLTVKEKILLQLGESRIFDPDESEFPLEATQKGLSEEMAVRRSHVADRKSVV